MYIYILYSGYHFHSFLCLYSADQSRTSAHQREPVRTSANQREPVRTSAHQLRTI